MKTDYLIIGAGIIGLTLARELNSRYPSKTVTVIEKEPDVAFHSSGRNSGVLHAGFYYAPDSLKAQFTRQGNMELKKYCREKGLRLNECKKVVVVENEKELDTLYELERRCRKNGVEGKIVDEKELSAIEPNAKTYKYALYSPSTATVDPVEICRSLRDDLLENGISMFFETPYKKRLNGNTILAGNETFEAETIINAAGLYADKIANDFGYSKDYCIIPFKGIYLYFTGEEKPVKTNVYPVPNLKNPFLGVHYTITVNGDVEIGPTAIPAFWRENYQGTDNFRAGELVNILFHEGVLFLTNAFGFRDLAFDEIGKYKRSYLAGLAEKLVKKVDTGAFTKWGKPGIRAQLLNKKTRELVQDFVVEGDSSSVHILNAVSPAFTSSIPFTRWVADNYLK